MPSPSGVTPPGRFTVRLALRLGREADRTPANRPRVPVPSGDQVFVRTRQLTSLHVRALLLVLAIVLAPRVARPLPLYSRSRGVACANCHDVVPHLNAAGIAFAQQVHPIGAHASMAPGSGGLPVSAVGSAGLTDVRARPEHAPKGTTSSRDDVRGRFSSLELVAAGSPAQWLVAHLEAGIDREGPDVRRGNEYLRLGDEVPAGALALKAGRFDAELPFLSNEPRMTMAPYLSPIAFGARGLELEGSRSSWTAAAGLSLSDRTHAGGAAPRTIHPPLEDTYFQLGRWFGAQEVAAQMLFDRQDSRLATLGWLQHLRCQVAAQLACPGVTLVPSFVFDRFDDRPAPGVHEHHQYYMLESIVPLGLARRWVMTARYEHDYRTRNTYDPEDHRQQEVVQLAWQAIPNARLGLECVRTDDRLAREGRADLEAFAQASW